MTKKGDQNEIKKGIFLISPSINLWVKFVIFGDKILAQKIMTHNYPSLDSLFNEEKTIMLTLVKKSRLNHYNIKLKIPTLIGSISFFKKQELESLK